MGRGGFRLCSSKNWKWRKYQQPVPLIVKIARSLTDSVLFVSQVKLCDLRGWNLVHASTLEGVRVCKLNNSQEESRVLMTLNVVLDGRCTLIVKSKVVPMFSDRPVTKLQSFLDELDKLSLCPGIDASKFAPLIEKTWWNLP